RPVAAGCPALIPSPQGDDPANQCNHPKDKPYHGHAPEKSEVARGERVPADPSGDEEFGRLGHGFRAVWEASWSPVVVVPSPARPIVVDVGALVVPGVFIQIVVGRHESPEVSGGGDSCLPTLPSQVSLSSGAQS